MVNLFEAAERRGRWEQFVVAIRFEGSTATVTHATSGRARLWSVAVGAGLALVGITLLWSAKTAGLPVWGWLALLLVPVALLVAVAPERRIVFDAQAKVVSLTRRYPWQELETAKAVPFSQVYSIGVARTRNDEGDDDYAAVLRLKGGRNVTLWQLATPGGSGPELGRYIATEPDLIGLGRLTGFRREDRLD